MNDIQTEWDLAKLINKKKMKYVEGEEDEHVSCQNLGEWI